MILPLILKEVQTLHSVMALAILMNKDMVQTYLFNMDRAMLTDIQIKLNLMELLVKPLFHGIQVMALCTMLPGQKDLDLAY